MAWILFALGGAFFAAVVNILTKRALDKTDFTLAMVAQGIGLLLTLAAATTMARKWGTFGTTPRWALGLLFVSGIAAGLSWLSGYRALQLSDVARTTPLVNLSLPIAVILAYFFLHDRPSMTNYIGIGLMTVGALLVCKS